MGIDISRKARLAVATVTALTSFGMSIGLAGAARADYAPGSYDYTTGHGDVTCVGSDTVQVIGDFLADGDTSGHAGFNASGGKFKLISMDATADANVRVAYSVTSSADAGPSGFHPLSPTVNLRGGQFPAQRPNGSGSGLNALLNDVTQTLTTGGTIATYPEKVNCVRMSSLPTAANNTTAANQGWGGLHLIRAATDNLQAASLPTMTAGVPTTNVPTSLSRAQLAFIFSTNNATWGSIPGGYTAPVPTAPAGTTGNCATCTVEPLMPQNGSGTRNTFISDLTAAVPTFACCAAYVNQSAEENDPTALTNSPDPADAVAPFSGDRLTLWSGGYFHNPFVAVTNSTATQGTAQPAPGNPAYPGGASLNPGISLLSIANASDSNPGYRDLRGLWFVYRAIDDSDGGWQPGSTVNWAKTLFSGGSSFLGTSFKASPLVTAAGGTYAYIDCGVGATNWSANGCQNSVQ